MPRWCVLSRKAQNVLELFSISNHKKYISWNQNEYLPSFYTMIFIWIAECILLSRLSMMIIRDSDLEFHQQTISFIYLPVFCPTRFWTDSKLSTIYCEKAQDFWITFGNTTNDHEQWFSSSAALIEKPHTYFSPVKLLKCMECLLVRWE